MKDGEAVGRQCDRCSATLTGRQRSYCSGECQRDAAKDTYLRETYGITVEQWRSLYEYQGGVCAICERKPVGRRLLVVDHEHSAGASGKVRGLICSVPCNLRLVAKHKDGRQLRAAADYLDDPPAVRLFGVVEAPGRKPKPRKSRKRKPRA